MSGADGYTGQCQPPQSFIVEPDNFKSYLHVPSMNQTIFGSGVQIVGFILNGPNNAKWFSF